MYRSGVLGLDFQRLSIIILDVGEVSSGGVAVDEDGFGCVWDDSSGFTVKSSRKSNSYNISE